MTSSLFWFESREISPVKLLLWGGLGSFSRSCEKVNSFSPEVSRLSSDDSSLARRFLFASAVLVICWTGRNFKVFGVRKFCLCTQSEVFDLLFGIFLFFSLTLSYVLVIEHPALLADWSKSRRVIYLKLVMMSHLLIILMLILTKIREGIRLLSRIL